MALPAITSNSPSAGYITWTASTVSYGGSCYPLPAGNSNKKFTYWDQSASTPGVVQANGSLVGGAGVLVSVDVLPGQAGDGSTTWDPNDLLLYLNRNGIGLLATNTSVVDGSLIVTGSILADSIGANQIVAGKIAANAVDTAQLNANSITGAKIQANQIGASHLIAGAVTTNSLSAGSFGSNMMPNAYFEDWYQVSGSYTLMPEGWALVTGSGFASATATRETASTITGGVSLGLQPSVGNQAAATTIQRIPCRGGEDLVFQAYYAGTGSAATGGVAIGAYYYDAAGALITSQSTNGDITGGSTIDVVTHIAAAPSNARSLQPLLLVAAQQKVLWDELTLQQRTTTAMIKDGQITAVKFKAGSINIGGGGPEIVFQPGYDPSTKATITALSATDANVANVDTRSSAEAGYAPNPFFDKWAGGAGTAPDNFTTSNGVPIKETTIVRTSPYSLRFNVTAGAENYVSPTTNYLGNTDYVTVTSDVYLVSGDWVGSGLLVRWRNTGGGMFDGIVNFGTVLSAKPIGSWYRVQQVVPRPAGFSGTFQDIQVWPIAGYSAIAAVTAKNIIFDQLNARTSTGEEIKAWTAGLWAYPGTTKIDGGLIQTGTVVADTVRANVSISSPTITGGSITGVSITGTTSITGATIQTDPAPGQRVVVRNDGSGGIVEFFTGQTGETASVLNPSLVMIPSADPRPSLMIQSGGTATQTQKPYIQLISGGSSGAIAQITLSANTVSVSNILNVAGSASFSSISASGLKVGTGKTFGGMDADTGVFTPNASGIITVPHGLGVVPTTAIATGSSHYAQVTIFLYDKTNSTGSNLKFYVRDQTNAAVTTARTVSWVAFS